MKCYHLDILTVITAGALGGSSVLFAVIFCVGLGGCEGFTTEKAAKDLEEFPEIILIGITVFFTIIAIFGFLLFYRLTMYVDASLFRLSIRGKREARKCKICGKHPYFQKYHAKKLHNLKITKLEENFDDCGCELCFQRKTDWKKAWEP